MRTSVELTASVWLLKDGDQYDYSSSYKGITSTSLSQSAVICQRGNSIAVNKIGERCEGRVLAVLVVVKGLAALVSPEALGQSGKMWVVVRSIQKQSSLGYRLVEGDIFRMGPSQWEINEIHSCDGSQSLAGPLQSLNGNEGEQRQCKICLGAENDQTNALIAPCLCKGSVQYVHVNCLDSWIGSQRRGLELKYDKKYTWKNVVCSVCKAGLPMDISTSFGTVHNLGVPKPKNESYVGLRNLNSEGQEIHIWQWNGHNSLSIGGGSCNKIRMPDEGLSDEHAVLRLKNSSVYLQDHNSQMGTLVLARKPIVLKNGERISVQCGNTVLSFMLKEKRQLLKCFSASHLRPHSPDELKAEIGEVVRHFARSVN